MKNELGAAGRIAALLAIVFLGACAETKTGSNGTGAVPAQEKSLLAGTLIGAEPFSIGSAALDVGSASLGRDEAVDVDAAALRLGMNLEAAGSVTLAAPVLLREGGTQSAVRGPVRSVDAPGSRFSVATFTILVDANTLYDGVAGLPAIAPGAYVEVSGLPLADLRAILATRITQLPAPADGRISVAARIESISPQGLTLAGLSVPGAASGALSPGTRIRVSGIYNPQSSSITNEQVVPIPDLAPASGTRVEVEGIALDVAASGGLRLRTPARDYDVAPGAAVQAPIAPGSRVRVIGTATGATSLTPTSATVIAPGQLTYRVSGTVSDFSSLAALRVRGEPVDLTIAVIRGGNAADIANGRRLAIVGIAGSGALRASEATLLP